MVMEGATAFLPFARLECRVVQGLSMMKATYAGIVQNMLQCGSTVLEDEDGLGRVVNWLAMKQSVTSSGDMA